MMIDKLPNIGPDCMRILDISPDDVSYDDTTFTLLWSNEDTRSDALKVIDFYFDRAKSDKGSRSFIWKYNDVAFVVKFDELPSNDDLSANHISKLRLILVGRYPNKL